MFQPHNFKHACYKLMAYLGVIDCLSTTVAGTLSGYFAITGVVYCSWPYTYVIHLFGTVGLGFWFASSSTSVILAINRCTVMVDPVLGRRLFDGRKVYVWLAFPTLYIVAACLFYKPLLYTSIYVGWYSNPHIGYYDELLPRYYNLPHIAHNMSVLVILTLLYSVFGVVLCRRYRQMGGQRQFKKELSRVIKFC
ncbi:CRE-SRT-39 protein [Aphelenchoides avenae]|nr:CRE-SRT-39 protein [Aphelenchus avenae]